MVIIISHLIINMIKIIGFITWVILYHINMYVSSSANSKSVYSTHTSLQFYVVGLYIRSVACRPHYRLYFVDPYTDYHTNCIPHCRQNLQKTTPFVRTPIPPSIYWVPPHRGQTSHCVCNIANQFIRCCLLNKGSCTISLYKKK